MSKTAKKVLSIILTVIMVFSAFPMTAVVSFADEIEESGECDHNYVCEDYDENGHTLVCSKCNDKITEEHNISLVDSAEITCESDGAEYYGCKDCDYAYTETIKTDGHDYQLDDWDSEYEYYVCTICEGTTSEGHDYEKTETVDATCTESGYDVLVCKNCGFSIKSNYCSVEHDYDKTIPYTTYEGSCTSASFVEYKCKNCDAITREEGDEPAGHDYEKTSETKATCGTDGVTVYTCTVCGETKEDITPATGHKYVATGEKKAATCTENGLIISKCSVCGITNEEYYDRYTVSNSTLSYYQTEHNYDNDLGSDTNYDVDPSGFVEGESLWSFKADPTVKSIKITFDDDTEFESGCDYLTIYDKDKNQIDRGAGSYFNSKTVTIPGNEFYITLSTDGSVTRYGFALTSIDLGVKPTESEIIPALGHDFKDSKCSRCGLAENNVYLTYTDSEGKTVSNNYGTLNDAVSAANNLKNVDDATIKVEKNINVTSNVYVNGKLTIDIGDSKIKIGNGYNIQVYSNASLTVKGNDGIISGQNSSLFTNNGNLVIESGNYKTLGANIVGMNSGNVEIKGGNFNSGSYTAISANSTPSSTLKISGGNIKSNSSYAVSANNTNVDISGGEFSGTVALYTSGTGKITVSGGKFISSNNCLQIYSKDWAVSGGTFISTSNSYSYLVGQNTSSFGNGKVAYVVDSDGKVTDELAEFNFGNHTGSFTVTDHKNHIFTTPVCDICGVYDSKVVTDTTVAIVTIGDSITAFNSLADALNYAAINPKAVLTIVAEKVDLDADVTINNSACDFTIIATNSVINGISETGTEYYLVIKSGKVVFQGTLAGINCLVMENGENINSVTEPGYAFAVGGKMADETTETDKMYSIIEHGSSYHDFEDGVCKYCNATAKVKAVQGSETYVFADLDTLMQAYKYGVFPPCSTAGVISITLYADDMCGKSFEINDAYMEFNFGDYKTNCGFYFYGSKVLFKAAKGGIETENGHAIYAYNSLVCIKSGVYDGKYETLYNNGSNIIIEGGTFIKGIYASISNADSNSVTTISTGVVGEDTKGKVIVNGGTTVKYLEETVTFKNHETHTFEGPCCKYCGVEEENVPSDAMASVFTDGKITYYDAVEDAFEAAAGKTALITVIKSVIAKNGIVIDNKDTNITVNLNGKSIAGIESKPIDVKSGKIRFYGDGSVTWLTLENGQTLNDTAAPGYMVTLGYIPDEGEYKFFDDDETSTKDTALMTVTCIHPTAVEKEDGAYCRFCGEKFIAECSYQDYTFYISSFEEIPYAFDWLDVTMLCDLEKDIIDISKPQALYLILGDYTITADSVVYPDYVSVSAATGGIHTKNSPAIEAEYVEIIGGVYTSDSCEALSADRASISNAKFISADDSPAIKVTSTESIFAVGYVAADSKGTVITSDSGEYYGLKEDNTVDVIPHTEHSFDEEGACFCGLVNEENGVVAVILGENTYYFDNIYYAFSFASRTDGATIKLLDDIDISDNEDSYPYVENAKNLTFDLNGKTLLADGGISFGSSTVIITGNGTVATNGYSFYFYESKVTVENGTFTSESGEIFEAHYDCEMIINGGTFETNNQEIIEAEYGESFSLTVNDGTFTADNDDFVYAYEISDCSITINGGKFDVYYDLIDVEYCENVNIVINDCDVNVESEYSYDYYSSDVIYSGDGENSLITINGGDFNTNGYIMYIDEEEDTSVQINGGNFTSVRFLRNDESEGATLKIEDATIKCSDCLVYNDAEEYDEGYLIKSTVSGGEIETKRLSSGCYCDFNITAGSFVINSNDSNANCSYITISGGDFTSTEGYIIYAYECDVTISGGTFNSENNDAIFTDDCTVTISGGTFDSSKYALIAYESDTGISGGEFNGKGILLADSYSSVITGGTFNSVEGYIDDDDDINVVDYLKDGYVYKGSKKTYGINFEGDIISERVTVTQCKVHFYDEDECIYCGAKGEGKIFLDVDGTVTYYSTINDAASALEKASASEESTKSKKAAIYINSFEDTYTEAPITINAPGYDVEIIFNESGYLNTSLVIKAGNVKIDASEVTIGSVEVKKGADAELCAGTYDSLSVEEGTLAGLLCQNTILRNNSTDKAAVTIGTKDKSISEQVYVSKCSSHKYLDSNICSICGYGAVAKVEYENIITPYYFGSLDDAISETSGEYATITLLTDAKTSSLNISDETEITLDIGEYTLSVTDSFSVEESSLWIKSEGGKLVVDCEMTVANGGELGISDTTVRANKISPDCGYLFLEDSAITTENGINAEYSYIELIDCDIKSTGSDVVYTDECDVFINGGSYKSNNSYVLNINYSECKIIDGEFSSGSTVVSIYSSDFVLYGGTFSSTGYNNILFYVGGMIGSGVSHLLADGHLFKDSKGKISNTFDNNKTVTVVRCEHENGKVSAYNNDCHTVTCNLCGMEKESEDCIFEVTEVVPNCESQGSITYTCKLCGNSYTGDYSKESGHEAETTQVITTEATCTTEGKAYDVTYCTKCEKEISKTEEYSIPATGHTETDAVTENEKNATCTEDGSYDTVVYCSVCNGEVSRKTTTIPATGHTETEAVTENEKTATCTEDGSYDTVVYCSVCNKEVSRKTTTIPASGHKDENNDGKCDICNSAVSDNSCKNAKINVAAEKKIDYRSKVTIKATAENVPEGYILVMTVNGKEIKGTNTEVSYEYGEIKGDINYTVKVVDANGNVQTDANGNELIKDGGKITCNAGFFKKVIAFFRGLFGLLPKVTVNP